MKSLVITISLRECLICRVLFAIFVLPFTISSMLVEEAISYEVVLAVSILLLLAFLLDSQLPGCCQFSHLFAKYQRISGSVT